MKFPFPWISAGLGLILAMVLIRAGVLGEESERSLPLLTLLFISEFGFLVTAAGSVFAGRGLMRSDRHWSQVLLTFACGALAVAFFSLGILLWQGAAR